MKVKKIILILITMICLIGCTNIKDMSYDDIVNHLSLPAKSANTFRNGYQFYIPSGLSIKDADHSYAILTSSDNYYYVYFDLVSYMNKTKLNYNKCSDCIYSTKINYDKKVGYVEIKLWENNQYLIEIMYNYAKIEVMVNEANINKALINSISILNSVKYNDVVIDKLLKDDDLDYTEEIFDMFEDIKQDSDILDYIESDDVEVKNEVEDTDYIN